jgi:hypothetical protein
MKKFAWISLAVLACASSLRADSLTLNSLSNTSVTAKVQYNNGAGLSGSMTPYVSQFHMTYTPTGGSPHALLTYCVDLFHRNQIGVPYTVTPVSSLSSVFGTLNGNEMAYLYSTYGTQNQTGNAINDAALQLALWDLSLANHNPTTFTQKSPGVYWSGDNAFIVSNISGTSSQVSQIVSLTNSYLQAAQAKTAGNVSLLQSGPSSNPNLQQSVLIPGSMQGPTPLPVPATLVLALVGTAVLGFYGLVHRRSSTATRIASA